jgi:hypothetical protein
LRKGYVCPRREFSGANVCIMRRWAGPAMLVLKVIAAALLVTFHFHYEPAMQ